jgi:gamma-glutamyltranspeptidase / glutathione hydrolase
MSLPCLIRNVPFLLNACLGLAANAIAQDPDASLPRTMRPVIRGRHAAVSSMKAEATEVASRILQTGGNAFDAVVGGQAALAVTDFALNGVGSDAVVLVYDAREKKVLSINGEPRAPKLATIEWYEKNNGGKIPVSDGLLSGGLPGVVDAWYILLDRWGTMSFEQVLQPAIDLAENGFPLSEARARMIASTQKILRYPSTIKIYEPNGEAPKAGEIFKNPDLARTLRKLVEAERANKAKGRHEALKAARDRFYTGDIAHEMAAFSDRERCGSFSRNGRPGRRKKGPPRSGTSPAQRISTFGLTGLPLVPFPLAPPAGSQVPCQSLA